MTRATLVLANDRIRERARHWIDIAPPLTRVEFKKPRRTPDQNRKMYAMLTDVSKQHLWHGRRLDKHGWKLLFLDALDGEVDVVPNLRGDGFVAIGRSSSDLSVNECSDMIELLYAWGAEPEHPVKWSEPDVWGHPC